MPHVCKSSGDPCLNNIRKVWTISCRMSPIASKSDIPGALWLNLNFEKSFEKNQKFSIGSSGFPYFSDISAILSFWAKWTRYSRFLALRGKSWVLVYWRCLGYYTRSVEVNETSPMLGWRLQLQFSIFSCSPTSFFLSKFTGQFTKGIWEDTR